LIHMSKRRIGLLLVSHVVVFGVGFGAGVYVLPLLVAPPSPSTDQVRVAASKAIFTGTFRRDLKGSDPLHWGEGVVAVTADSISLNGKLAPGPDYKLYLSPDFVETEADFLRLKPRMVRIGDVRTFENFLVPLPKNVDPASYTSVIVWCESFGQFITAARYREGS
jgi:hypothetical protein